jgi:hypothetical protein
MKTLGGATFAWNAISQDYCLIESLNCLYEMCDEVAIVYGGTDGTPEIVDAWCQSKDWSKKTIHGASIPQEEWDSQYGRTKLSHFSNIAINMLDTDWIYYQQADEVTHESCFPLIRQAIETDAEAYLIRRLNLWCTPYTMLDVPQERKPVSTEIIRLVRNGRGYWCVDDAESIAAPAHELIDVRMYHMGFVRDKSKHLEKIRHMQRDVFLMDYDKRADLHPEFRPWSWGFTPKDIVPIPDRLPKFVEEWAKERSYPAFRDEEHELAKEFLIHIDYDMSNVRILRYPERSLVQIANDVIASIPGIVWKR